MNSMRLPAWFARAGLAVLMSTVLWVDHTLAVPQETAASQLPDLLATGQTSFEIPFTVGSSGNDIVEVVLQMSTDRGKTWKEHSRRTPDSAAFPFSCRQDQEIWFAIQTIDRHGQQKPAQHALKPELRIAVDTQRPRLEFQVRPDAAGRVVSTWTATDKNIDPCSMVIQYRNADAAANEPWLTVPAQSCRTDVQASYRDQLAWWPRTAVKKLHVRALIKDLAGNQAVVERSIEVPLVAGSPAGNVANPLRGDAARTAQNGAGAGPATTNYLRSRVPFALSDQYREQKRNATPQPQQPPVRPVQTASPDLNQNHLRDQSQRGQNRPVTSGTAQHTARETAPQPPRSRANRFASNSGQSPPTDTVQWKSRAGNASQSRVTDASTESWQTPADRSSVKVAQQPQQQPPHYNQSSSAPAASQPAHHAQQLRQTTPRIPNDTVQQDPLRPQAPSIPGLDEFRNHDSLPQAQWVSSTTGQHRQPAPTPSSVLVSGPELESLRRSAHPSGSQRFQLEYDIDAIGPEGVKTVELWMTPDGGNSWRRHTVDEDQRSPIDVEVDSEGIFGFRILVVSNEGLRLRRPRSGDPADMWVNVDTTLPTAQITAVPYGRGQDAGRLLVQWRASDINLRMRPVKLSWSSSAQGPWTTIEDGIRNEGQYGWKPGADIPDQVFLKLDVRDVAGNVATHQLDRPVDVSGLIPRGRIRAITPLREPPPDAAGPST